MDMEEKVEELSKEVIALRREILIMKALIRHQSSMLKDLVQVKPKMPTLNLTKPLHLMPLRFPLKTQKDLDDLEAAIDETTEAQFMQELRYLIGPEGLAKNARKILSQEIVLKYNLSGLHNKRRLQDYPRFLDILYKASAHIHDEHSKFIEDLRLGLSKMKSRHFRAVSAQRKKENESALLSDDPLVIKKIKQSNDD